MFTAIVLLALGAQVTRASAPSCAVLLGGDGDDCERRFAALWLAAAQEEAARTYHTLNGGWLEPACCPGGPAKGPDQYVAPFAVPLHHVLCIPHSTFDDETCAKKKCDFESHPELFEDDCVEEETPDDTESCRTIESWFMIAKKLLMSALLKTELCDYNGAASDACAADTVYTEINKWIAETYETQIDALQFINDDARAIQHYTHINSPVRRGTFEESDFAPELRMVQSIRTCGHSHKHTNATVTSLIVYGSATGDPDILATTQLIWALAGTLSDFATVLPFAPNNDCGLRKADTNLELFAPARQVPNLGPQDWATVRCDGEPRITHDLRINAICPVVLLFAALGQSTPHDLFYSLAQVQIRSGFEALEPLAAAQLLEAGTVLRVATGAQCEDFEPVLFANVVDECEIAEQPVQLTLQDSSIAVPLTLPPGASQCVGGAKDGQLCSSISECGAGFACRRKPFTPYNVAYCYDGYEWDTTKTCASADEDDPCPYGTCVGAVTGHDGGVYPMLHFHQEADCKTGAASDVCEHEAVVNWHKYPNLALFTK